ncbi:hypothetical protein EDD15DRAFT_2216129 [Pisolithus albus]|nr:hypothetical protein EDD15DRAFT_2216129 [Pisolithus albus]
MSTFRFKFPPFPSPPPYTSITPFPRFSPQGYIRVQTPDGDSIELDAFAHLPTLKIDTEEEVTRKKKEKKKRRCAGRCVDENGRLIPWWEEWEMEEEQRGLSFDPVEGMSYRDRLHLAADDFRVGRTWPAQGVRPIWDRFRLYIGLLSSMPVYSRIKAHGDNVIVPYEEADAEEDVPRAHQTYTCTHVGASVNTMTSTVQDTLQQGSQPSKSTLPDFDDPTSPERIRLDAFLTAISKGTKIFLSSYLRETGLVWTESNLFVAPMLLKFFLKFLKRTGVFWDSDERMKQELEDAVGFAEKAVVELPVTARLGRTVPGKVERGFVGLWGKKCIGLSMSAMCEADDLLSPATEENSEMGNVVATAEDDDPWIESPSPTLFHILGPTTLPLAYTTVIVETGTRRVREVVMPGSCFIGRTGTSEPTSPFDDKMGLESGEVFEEGGREDGKRDGLEEALESKFAMVILEPWVSSEDGLVDTSEVGRPTMWCTFCATTGHSSTGVDLTTVTSKETELVVAQCPHVQAHNPYIAMVNVLVDLESVELFKVGMGVCGTWVQLRRMENMTSVGIVEKRSGSKRQQEYWYIEDLTAVFPSFHTDGDGVLGGYLEGEHSGEEDGDGDGSDL